MSLHPQKRSRPYGLERTPFDPASGKFFPTGDVGLFRELTIVEVGHDVLLCVDREARSELILKPWALRRSSFDGLTIDDVLYTSTDVDVRTATLEDESTVTEEVVASYVVGEKVMAYKRGDRDAVKAPVGSGELTDVGAGDYLLQWEDVNTAGRGWTQGSSGSSFVIGVVVAPSTSGSSSFFTVNVYGSGIATLAEAPTQSGVSAANADGLSFWRGEVVALRLVSGSWRLYKFLQANQETIPSGALWVRPKSDNGKPMGCALDYADVFSKISLDIPNTGGFTAQGLFEVGGTLCIARLEWYDIIPIKPDGIHTPSTLAIYHNGPYTDAWADALNPPDNDKTGGTPLTISGGDLTWRMSATFTSSLFISPYDYTKQVTWGPTAFSGFTPFYTLGAIAEGGPVNKFYTRATAGRFTGPSPGSIGGWRYFSAADVSANSIDLRGVCGSDTTLVGSGYSHPISVT